jgi:EmrB/QacA subfamily drug resistance transporter
VPRIALNQKIAVSVVFVSAMFMNIMDITIVNVALPTIGHDFSVRAASLDAVAIGYLVSLAVVIPASGWLGDKFGTRRIMLLAIAIFTLSSALCGLATSFGELVTFRVLQGVGGGMLTPTGMAMLYRAFPPAERVRASSILIIPTAFAPALGPVLGGLLVDQLSWRWVFFVNVPIGAAALLFGMLCLAEQRQEHPGTFDLRGFVLSGIGFAAVMYGISEGPGKGWGSPQILTSIAAGAVLLVLLVITQRRTAEPLLDLNLFGERLFRSTTIVIFLATAGFLGTLYVVALFYQNGLGLSALQSGLSTFPEALGVMCGAQVVSRVLYPRLGPRRVMLGGLVGVTVFMCLMATVGFSTNLWVPRILMFFLGYWMSHCFVSSQAAAFAQITGARTGRASTLFNAERQLGSAIGVAVLSSVIAAIGATSGSGSRIVPHLTAYHAAFLAAAGLMVLAGIATLTIHDSDAHETYRGWRKGAPEAVAQDEQVAGQSVPALVSD